MIDIAHRFDDSGATLLAHLPDAAATEALGGWLAAGLSPGLVIYLIGDLGAGKTTLVRGLLRRMGHSGKVKSPTYTLIEPYVVSRLDLYHFDFYRFTSPEEYLEAGLDEYFAGQGVCLVEWPDKAAPFVPPADVELRLATADGGREVRVRATTEAGKECLRTLQSSAA